MTKENLFYLIGGVVLLILVSISHAYGHVLENSNLIYTSIQSKFYLDHNAYFSWFVQVEQGNYLFSLFNTIEASKPIFFHPIFLIMGILHSLIGVPVLLVWYLFWILGSATLIFCIAYFLKVFVEEAVTRIVSFILITTSGSWGWLAGFGYLDMRTVENNIFQVLNWPFILSISLSLILLAFIFFYKFASTEKVKYSVILGFIGLLLFLIHPYNFPYYVAVPGAYVLYLVLSKQLNLSLKAFLKFLPAAVLPIFGIAYYAVLFKYDWVFAYNNATLFFPSPNVSVYVYTFGVFLVLAFGSIGVYLNKSLISNKKIFILLWLIVGAILLYSPFTFQNRLELGLSIPILISVSYSLTEVISFLKNKSRYLGYALIIIFLLLASTSNVIEYKRVLVEISDTSFPLFLSADQYNSLQWLKNAKQSGNVITSYEFGSFIPRFTSRQVYASHWAQTINLDLKLKEIDAFYSGVMSSDSQNKFLKKNNLIYIYFGEIENNYWDDRFGNDDNFELAFTVGTEKIYKYKVE